MFYFALFFSKRRIFESTISWFFPVKSRPLFLGLHTLPDTPSCRQLEMIWKSSKILELRLFFSFSMANLYYPRTLQTVHRFGRSYFMHQDSVFSKKKMNFFVCFVANKKCNKNWHRQCILNKDWMVIFLCWVKLTKANLFHVSLAENLILDKLGSGRRDLK